MVLTLCSVKNGVYCFSGEGIEMSKVTKDENEASNKNIEKRQGLIKNMNF